jgi:membrane protein DedA with SNARE-associated domain/rhodanese-related sulfurtransferase
LDTILEWLGRYGLAVAFANVWAAQTGLPFPAYPVLIVTGALSATGRYSAAALLATAVAACLLADLAWYAAGRRLGNRLLRVVCRISISPDSCVRQTETLFARWGIWSLLVAKLIPGFSTIATVLSGNARVPIALFLLMDALGAALYAGIAIGLGIVFRDAVVQVLAVLSELGRIGPVVLLAAFALFIAAKWWQRHQLISESRMSRISVEELKRLLDSGAAPTIIDARPLHSRLRDGFIPGTVHWSQDDEQRPLPDADPNVEVVVYCACPNEVSAAKVARRLRAAGFVNVRPLHGGIDAWIEAGLPIERAPADDAGDVRKAA